jgi:hypothetical protein
MRCIGSADPLRRVSARWAGSAVRRTAAGAGNLPATLVLTAAAAWFGFGGAAAQAPEANLPPALVEQATVQPVMSESPIPTKNLLQVMRDGGPLMVPIGVCSFLLLVFVFERAVSLRRGRVIPGPFRAAIPRAAAREPVGSRHGMGAV